MKMRRPARPFLSLSAEPLVTQSMVAAHGLTADEYELILTILGRVPNITELGILSVMWSEHCSYKSSKKWLRTLPTQAPWVLCGPGENAGVIDIGDGQAAIFKMESHNHPSCIEPYQGAATGVGGILRDVLTMGARPIANMNALRFGSIDNPYTRYFLSEVVRGISHYGNCVGVPTVGGEINFHATYNKNIVVNTMTVGVAARDKIFSARASGIGNVVVYVGAKTGQDGIHGATMASAAFDADTVEKRPTVQVGDPFTKKLLIEACLELMATDAIIAIQDMGAAGLTSSLFEMASKGGLGIDIDLDQVPQRVTGMTAYELMLSESQERMLVILRSGQESLARSVCEKWELDFAIIGHLTGSNRMILRRCSQVVADLPIASLAQVMPEYHRRWHPSQKESVIQSDDVPARPWMEALRLLIACPDIASKRWVYEQYDHMVMGDTVQRPGGDSAVVRVHGTHKGLALTTDCTPRYCAGDARAGGCQAVAEAWRNLTAVGAMPLAITDNLNFGNPEKSHIMGQLIEVIEGMSEACRSLNFPVVSGNVSLYNETAGQSIMPTPAIGGVGLIATLDRMATLSFKAEGEAVLLVGDAIGGRGGWLGRSLYLREVLGREEGSPPEVNLYHERRNGDFVRGLIQDGLVTTCHDVSDGGLLVALAEMAMTADVGITVSIDSSQAYFQPLHAWLFGEDQGRYILTIAEGRVDTILRAAAGVGVSVRRIGTTGGDAIRVEGDTGIPVAELKALYEGWLPGYMAGGDGL
ncbi:Phosphoribosylformylglycinamidine synthase, synthetase subunit [invertebrate metagenome]|uniref:Phosphoribosylformylglycinamidine synthase, synthetase subunit n=1 Tax=invertebrate metagenome TaxID=1711999 RepID=A0A484H5I8_9ZZZZ